ncbi:MAG: nucleoside hydrolase [Thermoprotei archaeon]|nr:nucleoside hydrolase [Thermoprotei archaeon]
MPLVIYDNDLAGDFDGTVGLAVLLSLDRLGYIRLYGIGLADISYWGPTAVDNAVRYALKRDVPIGVRKDVTPDKRPNHAKASYDRFGARITWQDCEDVVKLYRRLLADAPDKSIVLISAGPLTNIANLLRSRGDDVDQLSGIDLIERKVTKYIAMAGDLHVAEFKEYNVVTDIESARYVFDNFPRSVPLIVVDFRVPYETLTGDVFAEAPEGHPIRAQWEYFKDPNFSRPSWDPYATLLAHPEWRRWFRLIGPGRVTVDEEGHTVFNERSREWKHYYIEHLQDVTKDIMRETIHEIIKAGWH